MKKSLIVSFVAVVLIAAVGISGSVFAQGPDTEEWTPGNGYGYQAELTEDGFGIYHEELLVTFSEVLGVSVETLTARVETGETLVQIAIDSGMSLEEIQTLMPMGSFGQQGTRMGRGGRYAAEGSTPMNQQMNADGTGLYGDGTCLEDGAEAPADLGQQTQQSRGGRWNR